MRRLPKFTVVYVGLVAVHNRTGVKSQQTILSKFAFYMKSFEVYLIGKGKWSLFVIIIVPFFVLEMNVSLLYSI